VKYYIFFVVSFLTLTSCAQVPLTSENVAIDDSLKIAVIQVPKNSTLDKTSTFEISGAPYTLSLTNSDSPLIQIDAPDGIVNEPKRMAQISYAYKDTVLTSNAGIELRGSSSLVFKKKTYDLNFYTDSTGTKNQDLELAGMRSDDDWILDGLYNEPLRMRSHLSLNLWNDIYTPYYIDKEPNAKAGASGKHSEVFVNGRYQGIFLFQEQVDRKLAKIKKIQGDTIRGEIFQGARYLGACTFDSIPPKKNYLKSWGGYDIKYPVPTNQYWDNIYPFTAFVVNSDDDAFAKAIKDKFVIDNAIDYFLFINALRAPDNLGKNLYLIRYDAGEPYFYAPWDLDGSFGTIYSGKRINTTDDFLTNGLLRRLIDTNPDHFVSKFGERWKSLRKNVLSEETLLNNQKEMYNKLLNERIYEREALVWDNFEYGKEGLDYMQTWTKKRLAFLDEYIDGLK